jgi:hypothetical protein
MKGYGQYCPIAKATEVVGERWTNLVIRELAAGGISRSGWERTPTQMSNGQSKSRSLCPQRSRGEHLNPPIPRTEGIVGGRIQHTGNAYAENIRRPDHLVGGKRVPQHDVAKVELSLSHKT